MSRLAWVVNPSGYKRILEYGFDIEWTGKQLAERKTGGLTPAEGFWNPPNSDWMLPAVYQLTDPRWYANTLLAEHLLTSASWTLAPGATQLAPWYPNDTAGHHIAGSVGMVISVGATLSAHPALTVNFANLATAAGVTLPTGIGVMATSPPIDGAISPHLEFGRKPPPEDLIVFGWGNMCLLWWDRVIYLLRSTSTDANSLQAWELLGRTDLATEKQRVVQGAPGFFGLGPANLASSSFGVQPRTLTCVPVGWEDLYFFTAPGAAPWIVPTRDEPARDLKRTGVPEQVNDGKWWIGGWPNTTFLPSVQTVGYRDATHLTTGGGALADASRMIDLGQEYQPTNAPQVWVDGIIHGTVGGATMGSITSGREATEVLTGQRITVQLLDENQAVWSSDGTHFRGAFKVELRPGAEGFGILPASVAPQFRKIQLKFPAKLAALSGTPLWLYDDQHYKAGWTVSNDLRTPGEGKQIRVPLTKVGADAVRAAGYDTRHDIPIELREDTANDATYATTRVAGWIVAPSDTTEIRLLNNNVATPQDDMVITALGLLKRADEPFMYAALVVDPANSGELTHTTAVEEALLQAGFDVTDSTKVQVSVDLRGDVQKNLPGGAASQKGTAKGTERSAYAPDYNESKLDWIKRIRDDWSLWLLWEQLAGRVFYQPDPVEQRIDYGVTLGIDATFYRTPAAAVSAGANARQAYHALSQRHITPVITNIVRIIPCDPDEPQVFCRAAETVTDTTNDNYVGYYLRCVTAQPKMADGLEAAKHLAEVALRRLKRKRVARTWSLHLAPWRIASGIDVGSIVQLAGGATYQIVKLEFTQDGRPASGEALILTTITGEKLPTV